MPDDDDADLGARPADDALALEVARARISKALFATDALVRIGRYQLLQRAGAGGMGVVWSAWDPELERRVAVKLMHVKSEAARAAMLREGQSLARLSHPNIVPIYDVGTVDDQVYLVMEWIAGVTLRTYAADHSTRELLASFLAAGAGVAAAHRAGIVQRDFKPDNVMIGHDGRVRVLDFGLARPEHSDGSVGGTPRYMAPEQARGEAPTPAADQFSFGVALEEAFAARRDAPAAVATVVARATAEDPAQRYPDMATLLTALAHDPARIWRRRAVVAAAAIAALGAFAIGRLQTDAVEPCAGDPLAQIWNPARSAALVRHLTSLGPYGAAHAPELVQQLAAHGATWAEARRAACLASHRHEITPALYERGLACLERARAALDTVAATMTRAATDRLPDAVLAARNVPDPRHCLAEATTDAVPAPRRALAGLVTALGADATKARYLALAADPAALPLARATAEAAGQLDYAPLVARAQLALGAALEADPSAATAYASAATAYATAADAALRGLDDVAFVEAFAHRLFVASRLGEGDAAPLAASLPFVTALGRRTGDAGRFARALLYNNAATERLAAGDKPGAVALLRQARAEPEPAERGVELWAILGNLAMVVGDRDERDALFAEERGQLERSLGPDHPFTLQVRLRAAMFIEHPGDAAARLREICATYLRLHPDRHDKIASCHAELAWLAVERDDAAEAARAYAITATQPARDAALTSLARAELRRLAHDPAGALTVALPVSEGLAADTAWWRRLSASDVLLSIAASRAALTQPAVPALRAARTAIADALAQSQATAVLRRRARIDALLAVATRDRARAAEAAAWYRRAGGYDAALAALDF